MPTYFGETSWHNFSRLYRIMRGCRYWIPTHETA